MPTILHVLDHSLPEHSGYAFRSHSILGELLSAGVDVKAITGPKARRSIALEEDIDGVPYLRTALDEGVSTSGVLGQIRTVKLTSDRIAEYLRGSPAEIIHAHSPCLNGLAALRQGRPLVYEMRSSWEDAAVSVGTTEEGSIRYRLSRMLETYVARRADAVVVICQGLKLDLVARGVAEDKITVVPNALSAGMFSKPDQDKVIEIRRRYSLDGRKVVGFFGSFFEWEGVASLLQAMPAVLESIPDAHLFIAGGGRQETALQSLAAELGLDDRITFAGRVPHDEISACYGAADVMAYPRLPDRLTNMVTPLKPLEAMAQGTVVVASDVGGHKELVTDGETGILFKAGDREDLANKIVFALSEPEAIDKLTAQAADYVQRERNWAHVVKGYLPVYERLASMAL